jgi:lysophospholipase L1-like esterase
MKVRRSGAPALVVLAAVPVGVLVGLALALAGAAPAPAAAHASPAPGRSHSHVRYYLALGDSLSQGVQPNSSGQSLETNQGYASDLFAYYRTRVRGLKLVDFGCPGDTTTSMLAGIGNAAAAQLFHCDRAHGSQLAAAVAFLTSHRGQVVLVTVDIGANDVDGCVNDPANVLGCVTAGEAAISQDTPKILRAIKRAAGHGVVLAAMDLYDPLLADELQPASSPLNQLGAASLLLARGVNADIRSADVAAAFRTADVATAFDTYDVTPTPYNGVTVPADVVKVCALTWACAPAPQGPNIHANAMGYSLIATTFESVIGRLR